MVPLLLGTASLCKRKDSAFSNWLGHFPPLAVLVFKCWKWAIIFAVTFLLEEVAAESKNDFLNWKKGIYNIKLGHSSERRLKRDSLKLCLGKSVVWHKFLFFLCVCQLFSLIINGSLSIALWKMLICGSSFSQLEKEARLAILPGFCTSLSLCVAVVILI